MMESRSLAKKSLIQVGIDATSWRNDRGFGRFTRELVTALAARDGRFRYTLVLDQPLETPPPPGLDTLVVGTADNLNQNAVGDRTRSVSYLMQMGAAVRKADFDIFFFPAVFSYFPLLARTPCVICYHDTTAERIPHLLFPTAMNHRMWQLKTRLAKWQTRRAMTVSQSSARDLETILQIPREKIDVVTEAADPKFRQIDDPGEIARVKAKFNVPLDKDLLITVGGMNAHKNILSLLMAMPKIIAERENVHLVIVGDTSGKGFWDNVPELMRFVANNPPLERHVHFTGYVGDDDLVVLLNGVKALAFPSLWEGFGLPAVEAMACGAPVLSSDRGSLPEVIGDAGLFYDPENIGEIEATVIRFFSDSGLQARLSEAAVRRAAGFTWEKAAELGEQCFERCIA
jgi:glycosyltransferase involved in cell wall biosynthesis